FRIIFWSFRRENERQNAVCQCECSKEPDQSNQGCARPDKGQHTKQHRYQTAQSEKPPIQPEGIDHGDPVACFQIVSTTHFRFLRKLDFIPILRGEIVDALRAFLVIKPLAFLRDTNGMSDCRCCKAAVNSRMILIPAKSFPHITRSASIRRSTRTSSRLNE